MIERNFAQQILFLPISNGADELRIISGYSTPNMASWLIKNIQERHMEPISIKLILGMTPYNGISTEAHRGFIDLRHSHYPQQSKFVCSYGTVADFVFQFVAHLCKSLRISFGNKYRIISET